MRGCNNWLVLDGTGKIVLLNKFFQAMLTGVAVFFSDSDQPSLPSSTHNECHSNHPLHITGPCDLGLHFGKILTRLIFPKKKTETFHGSPHGPSDSIVPFVELEFKA
jgi:hypothetical protein